MYTQKTNITSYLFHVLFDDETQWQWSLPVIAKWNTKMAGSEHLSGKTTDPLAHLSYHCPGILYKREQFFFTLWNFRSSWKRQQTRYQKDDIQTTFQQRQNSDHSYYSKKILLEWENCLAVVSGRFGVIEIFMEYNLIVSGCYWGKKRPSRCAQFWQHCPQIVNSGWWIHCNWWSAEDNYHHALSRCCKVRCLEQYKS